MKNNNIRIGLLGLSIVLSQTLFAGQTIPGNLQVSGYIDALGDIKSRHQLITGHPDSGNGALMINDNTPEIFFNDTDASSGITGDIEWRMRGDYDSFRIHDYRNSKIPFQINASQNNAYSFIVDTSGDINLANGSVWIDRSLNHVGIGTTSPEEDLHIKNLTTTTTLDKPGRQTKHGNTSIELEAYGDTKWSLNVHYTKYDLSKYVTKYFALKSTTKSKYIGGKPTVRTPFKVDQSAPTDSLAINGSGKVGIGTGVPSAKLDVRGTIKSNNVISSVWSGANTARDGTKYLLGLSANNSNAAKTSDTGFSLENKREGFKWEFRTYEAGQGFIATKALSGGGEFRVENTTDDFHNAKVIVGDVVIFEDGHLVNDALASRVDKQTQLLAETQTALQAKDEKIALLEERQKAQDLKIAQLETMKDKIALLESLLTNLALDTSDTKQEKVSLNSK